MHIFNCFQKVEFIPECSICLEPLIDLIKQGILLVSLHCGHIICIRCKNSLSLNLFGFIIKCPVCRQSSQLTYLKFKDKINCNRCHKDLSKLISKRKYLVHLECGHCFCLNCLLTLSFINKTDFHKCKICQIYCLYYPLYLN
jgi:hypothetical protein